MVKICFQTKGKPSAKGLNMRLDEKEEHLDFKKCCECGAEDHSCQDCPVFIFPEMELGGSG